jgi:hypothetical protein
MKMFFPKLLAVVVLITGYSLAAAGESAADATVLKVNGSVKATFPGQSESVVLKVGDHVPQGALITTGTSSQVFIQVFSGAVSTLGPSTTASLEKLSVAKADDGVITQQTAVVDLQSGNLISTIDPAKRSINNYAVRTPKGVAAARGTSYSVSVTANGVAIAATADSVTFTSPLGVTYTIQAGMISITPPGGTAQAPVPLASAAASDPAIAHLVNDAVAAITTIVENNLGGLSAESTSTLASQIVAVASAANPSQAATYTAEVTGAINSSNSVFAGNAGAAASASSAVSNASAAGVATTGPASTGTPGTTTPVPAPVINVINPPVVSPSS